MSRRFSREHFIDIAQNRGRKGFRSEHKTPKATLFSSTNLSARTSIKRVLTLYVSTNLAASRSTIITSCLAARKHGHEQYLVQYP